MNKITALVVVVFLLQACQVIPVKRDNRSADELIAAGYYEAALEQLIRDKSSSENSAQLDKKIAEVESKINRYEANIASAIDKYVKKSQWQQADQLLAVADEKMPTSVKIAIIKADFTEKRQQQVIDLGYANLVDKAVYLASVRDMLEKQYQILPSKSIDKQIETNNRQIAELRGLLDNCANNSESNKNWSLAKSCYDSAYQLTGDNALVARRENVNTLIQNANTNDKTQSRKLQSLESDYKKAVELQQWLDAKILLKRMRNLAPVNELYQLMEEQLDVDIKRYFNEQSKLAQQLYSQGEISAALEIWQQLKVIAPYNKELLEKIERASRVLENLDRLKQ